MSTVTELTGRRAFVPDKVKDGKYRTASGAGTITWNDEFRSQISDCLLATFFLLGEVADIRRYLNRTVATGLHYFRISKNLSARYN